MAESSGKPALPDWLRFWHGFSSAFAFLRAAVALAVIIAPMVAAALALWMDSKYAPIAVVADVKTNGQTAQALKDQVAGVGDQVNELSSFILRREIFDLRTRLCDTQDPALRRELGKQLQDAQTRYEKINDLPAYEQSCPR